MEKKIETYLPLYIGCDAYEIIRGKRMNKVIKITGGRIEYANTGTCHYMPILRRLISMKEEEAKEFICSTDEGLNIISIKKGGIEYVTDQTDEGREYIFFSSIDASRFIWLLSKGFDLFGLIDSNLAIDRDTL